MTMGIPFASRKLAFTVYKALVVRLPQVEEDYAIKSNLRVWQFQKISEKPF